MYPSCKTFFHFANIKDLTPVFLGLLKKFDQLENMFILLKEINLVAKNRHNPCISQNYLLCQRRVF